MKERAASTSPEKAALWHIDEGRALFAGPLRRNAPHRHSVPVYLAGLYGRFQIRVEDAAWRWCRTAVVPAGVAYEFDMGGEPLAVVYLEPNVAGADALVPLIGSASEVRGALLGDRGEVGALRAIYERRAERSDIAPALKALTEFSQRKACRQMDPRIARAVAAMQMGEAEAMPVAEMAAIAGLSPSRFQHLFTAQVGVPFRRYRTWHRLRAAIRAVVGGSTYTAAAHAAGFSDQPHFAREFRRTFGAPASRGLTRAP